MDPKFGPPKWGDVAAFQTTSCSPLQISPLNPASSNVMWGSALEDLDPELPDLRGDSDSDTSNEEGGESEWESDSDSDSSVSSLYDFAEGEYLQIVPG